KRGLRRVPWCGSVVDRFELTCRLCTQVCAVGGLECSNAREVGLRDLSLRPAHPAIGHRSNSPRAAAAETTAAASRASSVASKTETPIAACVPPGRVGTAAEIPIVVDTTSPA